MNFQLVAQILSGIWALDRNWANAQLPLIASIIRGKADLTSASPEPGSFVNRSGSQGIERPFAVDQSGNRVELLVWDPRTWNYIPNPNIPKHTVGIIPISSAITKYNVDCGAPGMIQRDGWLRNFINNDSIQSIVLLLDTPGGEARAADTFLSTMKASKKPIISYIDGMCMSLGMFFASASDKTFFSSENGSLGSIGCLIQLVDFSEMLAKEGIKVTELYAPQSVDKNKDYRDAMEGNYDGLMEDLRQHADYFINHVKTNRPEASRNEGQWNSGKTFKAKDAIKLGLADGVMEFTKMLAYSKYLARTKNNI